MLVVLRVACGKVVTSATAAAWTVAWTRGLRCSVRIQADLRPGALLRSLAPPVRFFSASANVADRAMMSDLVGSLDEGTSSVRFTVGRWGGRS